MRISVALLIEAQRPTQNPEIPKKHLVYTNFSRRVRVNFSLLPRDTSQEPNGDCSEKLVRMNVLFWADFFGWIFLSLINWDDFQDIVQISLEPGFGAYQSWAQTIKAPFARILSNFLQFGGFEGDVKTRTKPSDLFSTRVWIRPGFHAESKSALNGDFKTRAHPWYAPDSGWHAFRNPGTHQTAIETLRETEVQRRRGTTSPDPEKIPEPLRGPLGGFPVGIPREEKTPKSL